MLRQDSISQLGDPRKDATRNDDGHYYCRGIVKSVYIYSPSVETEKLNSKHLYLYLEHSFCVDEA